MKDTLVSTLPISKPVTDLGEDLSWVVVVEPTKRQTVVEKQMPVGDVQGRYGSCKTFSKRLADREIERGVPRQVAWWRASVGEAGAVVHVGGRVGAPRQIDVKADVQSISLVVIKSEGPRTGAKVGKAAGDGSHAQRNLIGVCEVNLTTSPEPWRANSKFPPADQGSGNGDWEKGIGVPDGVVIEEVAHVGAELVSV